MTQTLSPNSNVKDIRNLMGNKMFQLSIGKSCRNNKLSHYTFAMLIVCCSITSCIAVRSPSAILSNSSMQQTP